VSPNGAGNVRFLVLGPLGTQVGGGPQTAPGARKLRSLLAYLCIHSGQVVSTARLTAALWPDAPPRTAPTALHVYVSKLRQYLHAQSSGMAAALATCAPGYRLDLADHQLDLRQFEFLVERAEEHRSHQHTEKAAAALNSALALWRGHALADLRTLPVFESLGRRLDERYTFACMRHFEVELELGNHQGIIGELRSLVAERPTWESPYEYLMLALYRSGRAVEALDAYRELRSTLVQGLGVEPGPQVRRLHRAVLSHDPCLAPARPGGLRPVP
jgi:SARP family transcriptional regulator, regulator of embCAB operon